MAEIPEARKTPTSARPEEIDSPVPSAMDEFDYKEQELIRQNLLNLSPEALDKYFADRGLSEEERTSMRQIIEQMKASVPVTPEGDKITDASPEAAPSADMSIPRPAAVSPVRGTGMEEGQTFGVMPSDVLGRLKSGLFGDIGVGLLAEAPAATTGAAVAATLARFGLPELSLPAGAAAAGITGIIGSESFENTMRYAFGMEPHQYQWWEKGLSGVSGVMGMAAKGAVRGAAAEARLATKETAAAVEGAAKVKQATQALTKGWANANSLTEEQMTRLVSHVDDMFENRVAYYKQLENLNDFEAAKRALSDVPQFIDKFKNLEDSLNLAADLSPGKFASVRPGKQFVKEAIATSKERMFIMRNNLESTVDTAINAARKSGKASEGLVVPFQQVRDIFNELITDAAPMFPALKDGRQVVFVNGQFALQKGRRIIPIDMADKETLKRIRSAISENPYLKQLFKQFRLADNALSRVVTGEGGLAVAEAPVSVTIGQLADLRTTYSGLLKKGGIRGEKLAQDRVYYKLNQLEDRYLSMLENSDDLNVVQAVSDYRHAKDLSRASAEVFDDMVKGLNNDPMNMARAFSAITDDQARQFMRLKREVVPSFKSAVVDEDMPQYIARKILEDRFGERLFGQATKVGGVGQELIKELPTVVREIEADRNLVSKMEIYLGKEGWKSMLSGIRRTAKFAEDWGNRLEMTKKAADPKAYNAMMANTAIKAAEIATGVAGVPGASQMLGGKQYWLTKLITDSMGVPAVMKKVNQVVYTKYIDDVVSHIATTRDALRMRAEIIEAFGDNPVGQRVLQGFDERASRVLKIRMADRLSPGALAARGVQAGAVGARIEEGRQQQ